MIIGCTPYVMYLWEDPAITTGRYILVPSHAQFLSGIYGRLADIRV